MNINMSIYIRVHLSPLNVVVQSGAQQIKVEMKYPRNRSSKMGFMSVEKGEKMENRVLVTPTKVCKAKGKCEYVIKFYERALCVCV